LTWSSVAPPTGRFHSGAHSGGRWSGVAPRLQEFPAGWRRARVATGSKVRTAQKPAKLRRRQRLQHHGRHLSGQAATRQGRKPANGYRRLRAPYAAWDGRKVKTSASLWTALRSRRMRLPQMADHRDISIVAVGKRLFRTGLDIVQLTVERICSIGVLPRPIILEHLKTCYSEFIGTGTCSTISMPNPSSATIFRGWLVSRRMVCKPKSDRKSARRCAFRGCNCICPAAPA